MAPSCVPVLLPYPMFYQYRLQEADANCPVMIHLCHHQEICPEK